MPWILLGLTIFLTLVWGLEEYDRRAKQKDRQE